MAKNSGKSVEAEFESYWVRKGKDAFCYRLADAAEVMGRVGKIGKTRPVPSDYIVTVDGETIYSEIKSCENPNRFPFSNLRPVQSSFATRIITAGGKYFLYIKSLVRNEWYAVPYSTVAAFKHLGHSSISWDELKVFKWNI